MTTPIQVDTDFRSHRREVRDALNGALANRGSYLPFVLGLVATLTLVAAALAFVVTRWGTV